MLFVIISVIGFVVEIPSDSLVKKSLVFSKNTVNKEIASLRSMLLSQADVIDINWLHSLNSKVKSVRGGMMWSSSEQRGIASFMGLPKTQTSQTYMLWGFDLESTTGNPLLLKKFKVRDTKALQLTINPKEILLNPFKFELFLSDQESKSYPLLLAQP